MATASNVPTSNDQVFRDYYPYIRWHVSKAHIRPEYVEDYCMAIMEKFIKNDVLGDYDPEYVSEDDTTKRAASFRTFLSGFCRSYLRGYAEKDHLESERSFFSMDKTIGDNETYIMDAKGYSIPDPFGVAEVSASLEQIRRRIPADKHLFFDMVMLQVEEHGKVHVPELAELFDKSRWTIHLWLRALRPYFDEVFEK